MAKIVVAMSGGVDSSVAALLLKEQGNDLMGVSMQVWDYRRSGGCSSRATCCAPDDFTDARMVAAKIGIPYYVFDFEREFQSAVIDRFVSDYLSGRTPNPCVECNNKVKFLELRRRAAAIGCDSVATGHYAQIKADSSGDLRLYRSVDANKDQTYFLYGLKPSELKATLFPIGHMTKPEVREVARKFGLVTAEKPESQDICFVSGSAADFVAKIGGARAKGQVKLANGTVIGEHEGIHQYTIGQRRGIGVSGSSEPLYVTAISAQDNSIVVGPKTELTSYRFEIAEPNWLVDRIPEMRALVQVRYRSKPLLCRVVNQDSVTQVFLEEEGAAVTPGQSAVFYDLSNSFVLGGGVIYANLGSSHRP